MVEMLFGGNSNITIIPGSIQYTGEYMYQGGKTSDGNIVLSTGGFLTHTPGIYNGPQGNHSTGTGSNADLADLIGVKPNQTTNQNVLTFSFTVNDLSMNTISTNFVFASDGYSVGDFDMYRGNDVFGFFVDGVNYAVLPDGSPVSVTNTYTTGYIDGKDYGYAGRTEVYSITALLDPNVSVHTISIAIADGPIPSGYVTSAFDSGVFIGPVTLSTSGVPAIPEPETWAMLLAGLGLLGVTAKRRCI
jgi:hypothetical protein